MNVKTTFPRDDLEKEIYKEQSKDFTEKGMEKLVCRLRKNLYGLKQTPRQWIILLYYCSMSEAVKWILRYLRATSSLAFCIGGTEPVLVGYTDADMAGQSILACNIMDALVNKLFDL
ncbi:hypothetical protein Dimus_038931 [Dionaea muscipula]